MTSKRDQWLRRAYDACWSMRNSLDLAHNEGWSASERELGAKLVEAQAAAEKLESLIRDLNQIRKAALVAQR